MRDNDRAEQIQLRQQTRRRIKKSFFRERARRIWKASAYGRMTESRVRVLASRISLSRATVCTDVPPAISACLNNCLVKRRRYGSRYSRFLLETRSTCEMNGEADGLLPPFFAPSFVKSALGILSFNYPSIDSQVGLLQVGRPAVARDLIRALSKPRERRFGANATRYFPSSFAHVASKPFNKQI